jgi:surfactin synthase thioesterase subunit
MAASLAARSLATFASAPCAEALGIWRNWAEDVTGRLVEGRHFFLEHNPRETVTDLRALLNG